MKIRYGEGDSKFITYRTSNGSVSSKAGYYQTLPDFKLKYKKQGYGQIIAEIKNQLRRKEERAIELDINYQNN